MPGDLDSLQGSWTVTALEVDGQSMPESMLANARILVKGNRFTSIGMGAQYEGTLTLDPTTAPRRLDMKFDVGPEKGNTNLGIYELKGNRWKLCLATRGPVRPTSFATRAGSGFAFETLTRGKVAKVKKPSEPRLAASEQSLPATEFEGEWQMVSAVMNGQPMSNSDVQWVKRVTRGNQTTVYAGPQVMTAMQFTHDASSSPMTIDYVNTAGANKGKKQQGIYTIDGDLLKVCVSAPGAARPKEFDSKPGDGRTFTVWKRL
jgi:uncharacterized protein (TIGR03067 family)